MKLKPRGKSWMPGESGNPAGRPIGSRGQYSASFMRDLAADWAQRGPEILAQVAAIDPVRYLGVCASLIPRDVSIAIEARLPGGLEPDEWHLARELFEAVKQALPDAPRIQIIRVFAPSSSPTKYRKANSWGPTPASLSFRSATPAQILSDECERVISGAIAMSALPPEADIR
jgi:hypothetical protein